MGAAGTVTVMEGDGDHCMKKLALLATALAMVSGSALAADMALKALKAPPPGPFRSSGTWPSAALHHQRLHLPRHHAVQPQAFGQRLFRAALTASPRDFQLYVGVSGASISFPNRAAAEVDAIYGGARPST